MSGFSWAATVLVVALVASFVVYLVSLRNLPLQIHQPPTLYDRLGRVRERDDPDEPGDRHGTAR